MAEAERNAMLKQEVCTLARFFDFYGTTPHLNIVWELENSTMDHRQHFRDYAGLNAVLHNLKGHEKCCHCKRFVPDILNH